MARLGTVIAKVSNLYPGQARTALVPHPDYLHFPLYDLADLDTDYLRVQATAGPGALVTHALGEDGWSGSSRSWSLVRVQTSGAETRYLLGQINKPSSTLLTCVKLQATISGLTGSLAGLNGVRTLWWGYPESNTWMGEVVSGLGANLGWGQGPTNWKLTLITGGVPPWIRWAMREDGTGKQPDGLYDYDDSGGVDEAECENATVTIEGSEPSFWG